jgi:hypothetical protein
MSYVRKCVVSVGWGVLVDFLEDPTAKQILLPLETSLVGGFGF